MEFLITLENPHSENAQQLINEIYDDLKNLGLPLNEPEIKRPHNQMTTRGDPVTVAAIAAIAVGAGGALTVAMGKDGFLTQLAKVLEKYVDRSVQLEFKDDKTGEIVRIKGSAGDVRKILSEHFKN